MQIIREEIRPRITSPQARRLLHGRGGCFESLYDLVIDWYPPVILVKLYQPRDEAWLRQLTALLQEEAPHAQAIMLQERFLTGSPNRLLQGQLPNAIQLEESGLRYHIQLGEAQNTGFFLDMARGRELIRRRAANKKVLNLFAYTCSFSVAALTGDAKNVVNLDMAKNALEIGRANHRLNNLDERRATFLSMEFFRSISKLRKLGPFDMVICDPPADQGKSFSARTHWPKLIRKLPSLLSDNAEIYACLNARHIPSHYLQEQFSELLPEATLKESLQAGPDFPESDEHTGLVIERYDFERGD